MRCKAPESGNQTAAYVQNHTELTFLTERNPKNLCVQKRPGELLLGIFAKIDFVYSLKGEPQWFSLFIRSYFHHWKLNWISPEVWQPDLSEHSS